MTTTMADVRDDFDQIVLDCGSIDLQQQQLRPPSLSHDDEIAQIVRCENHEVV
jgi:hypothetical protein